MPRRPRLSSSNSASMALRLLLLALPRLTSAFNVCVLATNLGGYPLCTPGAELSYNGYDVLAFKAAAALAGWVYSPTLAGGAAPPANRTWTFTCYTTATSTAAVPWMLNASMYSKCAVLIGGVGVNTQRLQAGANFGRCVSWQTVSKPLPGPPRPRPKAEVTPKVTSEPVSWQGGQLCPRSLQEGANFVGCVLTPLVPEVHTTAPRLPHGTACWWKYAFTPLWPSPYLPPPQHAAAPSGYCVSNETAQMVIYDDSTPGVDIWSFIRPFTASLWIAFVATLLIIPPAIWLVEHLTRHGLIRINSESAEDLSQSLYRNVLAVFNQDVMYVGSFGGQLIMVAFLFMIMIVISTYTANLAAFETITTPGPTAQSLLDFAGLPILVRSIFGPMIAGMYPTLNVTVASASATALAQMLAVKSGQYAVAVESLSVFNSVVLALNDCNFKMVGPGIESACYAHVFHSLFPDDVKAEYNLAVIKMSILGEFDAITAQGPQPQCSAPSNNPVVSFRQVLGLWIILGGVCGFGVMCAASIQMARYFFPRLKVAPEPDPAATGAGGGRKRRRRRRSQMSVDTADEEGADQADTERAPTEGDADGEAGGWHKYPVGEEEDELVKAGNALAAPQPPCEPAEPRRPAPPRPAGKQASIQEKGQLPV